MTIISDRVEDISGGPLMTPVVFTVQKIRESVDGDAIVVPLRHRVQPVDGVITTPDLDPGPATVTLGGGRQENYTILIPESSTPIRLWPLIDAGMPTPPPSEQYQFVRNGGGVARTQAVFEDDYASMVKDPATVYYIIDSEVIE